MADLLIIFNAIKMSLYQQLIYLNLLKKNFWKTIRKEMQRKQRKDVKRN